MRRVLPLIYEFVVPVWLKIIVNPVMPSTNLVLINNIILIQEIVDDIMVDHPALAMFPEICQNDAEKENLTPPISPFPPISPNFPSLQTFSFSDLSTSSPMYPSPTIPQTTSPIHKQQQYAPLTPLRPLTPNITINDHRSSIKAAQTNKPLSSSTPVNGKVKEYSTCGMLKDSTCGLSIDLPFPECFSIPVEEAISSGNVQPVRLKLMNDVSTFYYSLCKHPRQGDYTRIARKVCERFPEVSSI
jgi:hypothetical protein